MRNKYLVRFGLKFHPFRPDVSLDALYRTPQIDAFCRRVEFTVGDGGFVMVTGPLGSGKSVTLRFLADHLSSIRDVVVGSIDQPQCRVADLYRQLSDRFNVPLQIHNRWGGFKALRSRWSEHIASTLVRPVLIVDEAQEMQTPVLNELRILASKDFDSRSLLCIVFAGDSRLPERLRHRDLQPIESRIRRHLQLQNATPDELSASLDHLLAGAGNPQLITPELKVALVEHAAANFRVLMNHCDELLAAAIERDQPLLDEQLFFEVFTPPPRKRQSTTRKR